VSDSLATLKKISESIIKALKDFFNDNADRFAIEMVFLYGSWARGMARDDSDIDLALLFSKEITKMDESFRHITDISLSLGEALKKDVNIIQIRWDFDKPMLYYNAIVSGAPLYIREPTSYMHLRNEAIFQMEDFKIFGIDWHYEVAKKNLEAIRNA
jgi:predicted nucleotidyltransferase